MILTEPRRSLTLQLPLPFAAEPRPVGIWSEWPLAQPEPDLWLTAPEELDDELWMAGEPPYELGPRPR